MSWASPCQNLILPTIARFSIPVVSSRIRRRRRSRHRRSQKSYAPFSKAFSQAFSRLRVLLLSSLLIVALYLLIRQPLSAESSMTWSSVAQPMIPGTSWVSTLAQATLPLNQQGGQITLNGRSVSAAWSQRQQQIGISDVGLMQAFGIDLLNSSDAAQQPVSWFSEPQATLSLPVWLTGQYRYLDIAELVQRYGWQVQSRRSTLQISTPSAKIMEVRQGRQSWGDRIAIDLDQPTPWQVSEQLGEAVITLEARIDSVTLQKFSPRSGNRLQSVKIEQSGDRTLIRIGLPNYLRPKVWSLSHPNRLLIDVRPDFMAELDIQWAPGIRWRQQQVSLGVSKFPVVSLDIDPRQSDVSLKPIMGNVAVTGTTPLLTTAQRNRAIAAINGGFFNRNTQMPLGAIRSENQWISGPILNRGAIAWNQSGETLIGHLTLSETATLTANESSSSTDKQLGKRFPILSLNSGFVGSGICRYTQAWGANYTSILDNEVLVTVRNQQVIDQRRAATAGQTTLPIPADGYLLAVRADAEIAQALAIGTSIQIDTATQPAAFSQYPEAMGAGPLLLQNRQIVLNAEAEGFSTAFIQQSAPRSVIATTAAANLALVTIHNRADGLGPSLTETAQLMQQMGFVHALNLDGGSSTTLYLGGQLLDRPSSTAARVHNGIGVFFQLNR